MTLMKNGGTREVPPFSITFSYFFRFWRSGLIMR